MIQTTPQKILIADDDKSHRMLLRFHLEKENRVVFEATNGKEAFEILSDNIDIRIILTDISMPLVDGFNLIKMIRMDKLFYRYIIVLTSYESKDQLVRALTLGADDYMTKPILPCELQLRIDNGKRLLRLNLLSEVTNYLEEAYDLQQENIDFILASSSETFAKNLTKIKKAVVDKDFHELALTSDLIKGGLLNLGLTYLSELASEIELSAKNKEEIPYEELLTKISSSLTELIVNLRS